MCFATMYLLDLIILIDCRNYAIAGFVLLHLYLKTENLAFNKEQFGIFVFVFDSKFSKPNNLINSFKLISRLK